MKRSHDEAREVGIPQGVIWALKVSPDMETALNLATEQERDELRSRIVPGEDQEENRLVLPQVSILKI